MQITLDPTYVDYTSLAIEGKVSKFNHAKRDGGSTIIHQLAELKISNKDELKVITGPGNFTATRVVCLISNAVQLATKCQLFARKKDSKTFRRVKSLQPYYAGAALITIAKK